MIAALLYLGLAFVLLTLTVATVEPRVLGPLLTAALSFGAMVVVFFIPHFVALGAVLSVLAVRAGALNYAAGQAALVIHAVCWTFLLGYFVRSARAYPLLDGTPVRDEDHPFCDGMTEDERKQLKPGHVTWAPTLTYKIPAMLEVDVTRDVVFREVGGVRLRLDVYRPRTGAVNPAVMYIHGGGWITGTRRQSRFMMYELAAAGWTVFAISYRRAPRFPLPAAIEDCKCALAWIRAHASEHGAREDRVVVMGGSAGGHLAAMVAMTPNHPRFQPGFEHADTSVQGAVVLYGVPDFERAAFGDAGNPGMALWLERVVFRARYRDNPALFRETSPATYVTRDAPPTLFVHGSHDHIVPITESRTFASQLRAAGVNSVHLLEVPLGQHAFEVFPSIPHQRAVRIIVRFLETLRGPRAAVQAEMVARERAVEQGDLQRA